MSTLIIINHSPFTSTNLQDATDILLTLAAFELQPDILLQGEGVHLLHLHDVTPVDGIKNPYKTLRALPIYDVNCIYIEAEALDKYGVKFTHLDALPLPYQLLNTDKIRPWLNQYKHCMVF